MINQPTINKAISIIKTGKVLDNSNAHEMIAEIEGLQNSGFKYIILDVVELEFLSSAGVGAILGTIELFREIGGDIIICNASTKINHVLEILDLLDYLTISDSLEQAQELCLNKV